MRKKPTKWNIKKAKKLFKDNDCELLEDVYVSTSTKMRYICTCKRPAEIRLFDFIKGGRCKKCAIEKNAEKFKFSYKKVKKIFKDGGCRLISKEYKNCMEKLEYECSCGRTAEIKLSEFKGGKRCKGCMGEKIAEKLRYTIEDVKEIFREGGCILISKTYKRNNEKLEYICNCRRVATIRLSDFQQGRRCKKCGIEKNTGENHHNYNPNLTDEDREDRRLKPEYGEWRKKVYKRDNYICQITGEKGCNLVAHHLEGYDNNIELRTVVSNGVTMDEDCHKLFHKLYGYGNNTSAQFYAFQLHQKMADYQNLLNIEV